MSFGGGYACRQAKAVAEGKNSIEVILSVLDAQRRGADMSPAMQVCMLMNELCCCGYADCGGEISLVCEQETALCVCTC